MSHSNEINLFGRHGDNGHRHAYVLTTAYLKAFRKAQNISQELVDSLCERVRNDTVIAARIGLTSKNISFCWDQSTDLEFNWDKYVSGPIFRDQVIHGLSLLGLNSDVCSSLRIQSESANEPSYQIQCVIKLKATWDVIDKGDMHESSLIGYCPICFEEEIPLRSLLPCGHCFCVDCISVIKMDERKCAVCRRTMCTSMAIYPSISSSSPSPKRQRTNNPSTVNDVDEPSML